MPGPPTRCSRWPAVSIKVPTMPPRDPRPFSPSERRGLYRAIYERRDIRSQFVSDPIPDPVLGRLLDAAHHGPAVSFMQPWDFILIRDAVLRRSVHQSLLDANRKAAERYSGERRALYDTLKLA